MKYPAALAPRLRARERARTFKPDLALFLARERRDEDLTQKEVAADAGTSHQNVSLWEKPHAPEAPTVIHVVEMRDEARPLSISLIRWQADRVGGVQLIETPPVINEPEPARSLRLIHSSTEILRANAERCADGHDDDAGELEQLERELQHTDDGLTTLTEHRAYLVQVLTRRREGRPKP